MLLEGKVALVTGSVRGTGEGIAKAFAREGAKVMLNQVKDEGEPVRVLSELESAGVSSAFCRADVTYPEAVADLVSATERDLGPIDILVNNYAAPVPRARFAESRWEAWQTQIDYTVKAAFLCTQAVLPGMRSRRWGRIISVNTIGIHQPRPTYHGYTAAKTAMLGFTRNLALDVGADNVTVNIVSPGLTLTREVEARLGEAERARHIERVPLARVGRVEDTANAVVFFASDLAAFVTGHYLPVCGGQVMA